MKSANTLQVIGFNARQILPADPEVVQQCGHATGVNDPSLRCCRRKVVHDDAFFEPQDKFQLPGDETGSAYITSQLRCLTVWYTHILREKTLMLV